MTLRNGEPRVMVGEVEPRQGWRIALFMVILISILGALASGMPVGAARGMYLLYEGGALASDPDDAEVLCPKGAFELHASAGLLLGCIEPQAKSFTDAIAGAGRIEIWVDVR